MNYITSCPRTDGFGAQFQNIIFDILFTYSQTNNAYVFPDIKGFEHNYNNDPEYCNKLIDYMNLKPYFKMNNPNESGELPHYNIRITYPYCENNLTTLMNSSTYKYIQSLFFENKQTPFDKTYYNVAIHIRRPNAHDNRTEGADTPNDYYLRIINHIRKHYNESKPLKFHIYSQGKQCDYIQYTNHNDTVLHLDEFVLDTFNGLVFADCLVTSGGSFSYTAAILSKGVIFYKSFWHKPSQKWVVGDSVK
jgi:hypothetical protein